MLESLVVRWGYLAIGLGTFLEGETVLLIAGALAHRGLLSLPFVMLSAFVGSVLGDQLWFLLGHRYGRPFIQKRPKLARHEAAVRGFVERRGALFVLGFRFLYGVRTVSPVMLGASGYPMTRFVPLNAIGAGLWAVCFSLLGYGVGAGLTQALGRASRLEELIAGGLVLALALWLYARHRAKRLAENHAGSE